MPREVMSDLYDFDFSIGDGRSSNSVVPDYNYLDENEIDMQTDCTNWKIDFKTGKPILEHKKPIVVTGDDAVCVWCYYALKTERNKYLAFYQEYGNDLIKIFENNNRTSEMEKQIKADIRRCLLKCRYLLSVDDIQITYDPAYSKMIIDVWITTIYTPTDAFRAGPFNYTVHI